MDTNMRRGTTHVNVPELTAREELRVLRLARELRLTDQILSLDLDSVSVEHSGPAPAWTTLEGDAVSFAYNKMPRPDTRVDIAVWLGTNAHELGHVLFSPRRASTLMYRVIESDRAFLPGIAQMHNIVEDQREERLLLGRFAPWAGYLTAALSHHLVTNDNSAWLLLAGRTWLPDDVRAAAKARMVEHRGQRDTDEVTRLVGEYQRLTDPGDTECDAAWDILQALHRLFEDEQPTGGNTCVVMEGGEPDTSEPGDGTPVPADEDAEPGDGDGDGDGDGSGSGDADGEGDGSGSGDGDSDATGEGDKPKPNGEGGGGGAGGGPRPDKPLTSKDVRKRLRDSARRAIEQDVEAKDDLDQIMDAIDHGRPGDSADGEEPLGRYTDATDRARVLHREVGDALLDLKDESEPGWNKRVESGRLNVRRMLDPNTEPDEMFDRYDPGMMDTTELEVVLLLDVSGSMAGRVGALAEATWAIRQAVDDIEGVITVLTYDSGPHRVFAEKGVRPDGRMFVPVAMGGTIPKTALREAFRLLDGAQAKNRLCVILTDGDWYGDASDDVIGQLNAGGVTTVCALLDPSSYTINDFHGCQYGAVIDDPLELARLFRQIAVERMTAWR